LKANMNYDKFGGDVGPSSVGYIGEELGRSDHA